MEDVNSWEDVLGLSSYKKLSKSLLKEAELPRKVRMRFIPSKNDLLRGKLSTQKVGKKTGYVDKFGNVGSKDQAGQREKHLNGMFNLQKPKEGSLSVLVLALMGNI